MTEADWLACTDPEPMLEFLQRRPSDRKFRLFACACCRHARGLPAGAINWGAVDVAERFADGTASNADRRAAFRSAGGVAVNLLFADVEQVVWSTRLHLALEVARVRAGGFDDDLPHEWAPDYDTENPSQCGFLRDIIGNPLRPVNAHPAWLTLTVVGLARQAYESGDFSALPILADALQDAGCENADVLAHCRGDRSHVRGCWVVDLVLGRE